jgi:hypothetical protein
MPICTIEWGLFAISVKAVSKSIPLAETSILLATNSDFDIFEDVQYQILGGVSFES